MSITVIENKSLRVGITPGYGARVVSLVDSASGREWMAQGLESPNTGEAADYRAAEAVGWDECFPTVSPWDGTGTAWRRRLRDHGDLWGRPWQVDDVGPEALTTSYADPQFRFSRALSLDGASLVAGYAVENLAGEPLPYLWAFHALFAVEAGDRIEIPGVDTVRASYLSVGGKMQPIGTFRWTGRNEGLPFSLEDVQPPSSGVAAKFLAAGLPGGSATLGRPGQRLRLAWSPRISDLGIWLTYGGWFDHQEAALEPTSAAADHLGQAIEAGFPPLAPGERRQWSVTLTVSA